MSGQLVPKKMLIDQIRHMVSDSESCVFTILTDKKRSIMLRFSEGKLIHSHCRSRNVEDAINAFNDCDELKFNHSNAQVKEQPELMNAAEFLQAIAPDEEFATAPEPATGITAEQRTLIARDSSPASSSSQLAEEAIDSGLQEQVCGVARDYIGMVANILVADVFTRKLSATATIDEIAASIPVPDHADEFRKRATEIVAAAKAKAVDTDTETSPDHRLFF